MPGKRIDDLTDLTVQGIWEAHLNGELAEADVVDRASVRAAGVWRRRGIGHGYSRRLPRISRHGRIYTGITG